MNRIKWAEKKAYQLLDHLGIEQIPIPVDDIAEQLDIKVLREPFNGELSGVLYKDKDETIIGVNATHTPRRRRFTIAHELGHFVMHDLDVVHFDEKFYRDTTSSLAIDPNEIEANAFAAALLMPEHIVRREVERLAGEIDLMEDSSEEICKLADAFDVSQQALLIRFGKLGLLV